VSSAIFRDVRRFCLTHVGPGVVLSPAALILRRFPDEIPVVGNKPAFLHVEVQGFFQVEPGLVAKARGSFFVEEQGFHRLGQSLRVARRVENPVNPVLDQFLDHRLPGGDDGFSGGHVDEEFVRGGSRQLVVLVVAQRSHANVRA
jgi:hypothetical protein